jgi:short subunit dehydrogenase-like uncharacterized protein
MTAGASGLSGSLTAKAATRRASTAISTQVAPSRSYDRIHSCT